MRDLRSFEDRGSNGKNDGEYPEVTFGRERPRIWTRSASHVDLTTSPGGKKTNLWRKFRLGPGGKASKDQIESGKSAGQTDVALRRRRDGSQLDLAAGHILDDGLTPPWLQRRSQSCSTVSAMGKDPTSSPMHRSSTSAETPSSGKRQQRPTSLPVRENACPQVAWSSKIPLSKASAAAGAAQPGSNSLPRSPTAKRGEEIRDLSRLKSSSSYSTLVDSVKGSSRASPLTLEEGKSISSAPVSADESPSTDDEDGQDDDEMLRVQQAAFRWRSKARRQSLRRSIDKMSIYQIELSMYAHLLSSDLSFTISFLCTEKYCIE